MQALEPFKTAKFDVVDIKNHTLENDLAKFREKIVDLDKRVA
jgi:hypothetical protein